MNSNHLIRIVQGMVYYWAGHEAPAGTIQIAPVGSATADGFWDNGGDEQETSPSFGWPEPWDSETIWTPTEDGTLDLRNLHPELSFNNPSLSFQLEGITIEELRVTEPGDAPFTIEELRVTEPGDAPFTIEELRVTEPGDAPFTIEELRVTEPGDASFTGETNQLPNIIPQYPDHAAATQEHLDFWQGSLDGNKNLPLKPGLSYHNTTNKRIYRSVQAATASESWIDAHSYEQLAGRVAGFISDLKSYLDVTGDALTINADAVTGTTIDLDETKINAGQLNGHTAQQIVEMSRQRQRVHNVDFVIDPRNEAIPGVVGAGWVTSHAGNGLSALTVYRLAASGAHQVIENLIPGDYVLTENDEGADVAYITKTIEGVVTLVPVGEDELTPPELKLVQILTLFGPDRITGLLESVEEFGSENWRTEQQITNIAEVKAAAVQALLQSLIDFGPATAVQLLTALQTFGPQNLIKISDVRDFYLNHNIKINFDPTIGSADPASSWYQRAYEAPFGNMTVNAVPDGYRGGFVYKNFDLIGPATEWIRTG